MITKEIALTLRRGHILYSRQIRYSDGSALQCRVVKKAKTWKQYPDAWQLSTTTYVWKKTPHQPSDFFLLIDPTNASEWMTYDPTDPEATRIALATELRMDPDTPMEIILDRRKELGLEPM